MSNVLPGDKAVKTGLPSWLQPNGIMRHQLCVLRNMDVHATLSGQPVEITSLPSATEDRYGVRLHYMTMELKVEKEQLVKACNKCAQAKEHLLRCGKCFTAHYCSAECQRADWSNHKLSCSRQFEQYQSMLNEELVKASQEGNGECVRVLISRGAKVKYVCFTAPTVPSYPFSIL
jgi:hypothetical protein